MDVSERTATLPPCHSVAYEELLSAARFEGGTEMALCLRESLPYKWRDLYLATVARSTNIVRLRSGGFEYFYDLYSELEITGEVPFDQTVEDRVVGVLGISARADKPRDGNRIRGWLGSTEEFLGTNRDKGHFIAHCIGGGLDINVFSQDRNLNRGWSLQGKVYRQMERYRQEHPRTFCFSRPVYTDNSSVPRWIEFGLIRDDETLWVEAFDNIVE
jgi:hypothetical protein